MTSCNPGFAASIGSECCLVQVIGVVVTRRNEIDEVQPRGIDHARGHADMRLVGRSVLGRERVGQIGILQQAMVKPFEQKAALAEPPDVQNARVATCAPHVCHKSIVLQDRPDQHIRFELRVFDDLLADLTRLLVLHDQLDLAVGHPLALDDRQTGCGRKRLSWVWLAGRGGGLPAAVTDERNVFAPAPHLQFHRLPLAGGGRAVTGVDHGVHHVAVVEGLPRAGGPRRAS